ncbi:hypothetical protein [Ornithinimicrobium cerasi]|uniref:Uncharacterized protein n=1 Tax=Ornithinimicrobium cerasi TaxID=2248773 RepID=A0A285VJK4_9MICO|nr:hypothetical protein [Ornithinimicrobium cerasi]SOC53728.1 hypothetical protein SAMN05421879_10289 [Ornithinimicrobium cerasi]
MDEIETPAEPTVWRLRGSSAKGTLDCIATDWWGLVIAHNVHGELSTVLSAAVNDGRRLPDLLAEYPEVMVDPVLDDLSHEPLSPVPTAVTPGQVRRSVLALDPFSTGLWQVETISGSRHILDLAGGGYRRISDVSYGGMDEDWYGIESIHEWPAVNATFTVQLFPKDLPQEGEDVDEVTLRALFDEAPFLTTAFVTRIVQITYDEADSGGVDLPPLDGVDVLAATPPRNAWLLMASDDSPIDVSDMNQYGALWTSPKHVERGDLALMYYIDPHKAVLYAARVESPPTYADPDAEDARAKWPHQWWSWLSAFVALDPVPHTKLMEYFGGQLVMRGKGGRYVPPWVVTQLLLDQPSEPTKDLVLQVPSGNPELPDVGQALTLAAWKELAAGAFRFEADVEHYVVEPLLNWLVNGMDPRRWTSKAPLGSLVPDYSIFIGDVLAAVVEVKLGIRGIRQGNSWVGPDLDQVRKYCTAGGVPGLLVDSNRILLFDAGDPVPVAVFERSRLTPLQLSMIRGHVFPDERKVDSSD